jgi:Zn-dependent protease
MDIGSALIWYVALLFSLTLHEAAHAWAAMYGGDMTAYHGGQVSLDPIPHIRREPFGTVVVPLLTYALSGWMVGWASTPYDPRWAWTHPKRAAWMSLAGPSANLLILLTAGLGIRLGMMAGVFQPGTMSFQGLAMAPGGGAAATLALFLSILFTLNLLLFVFNLIPVPPLDGSGVIGLFVSEDAARRLQEVVFQPQFSLFGILIAWFVIRQIFGPVHAAAIRLLYPEYF